MSFCNIKLRCIQNYQKFHVQKIIMFKYKIHNITNTPNVRIFKSENTEIGQKETLKPAH